MFVLTVDQRASRRHADAVPDLIRDLSGRYAGDLVLPFERTAGDEVQTLVDSAGLVVDVLIDLVRADQWSIGVGVGAVEEPLPASTRAGRGEAYVAARTAVEGAKSAPYRLRVVGPVPQSAERAETALWLLAGVLSRRSEAGWQAVDEMQRHRTQREAASALAISAQAMNRRLSVAGWVEQRRGTELAAHLLWQADLVDEEQEPR